MTNDTDQAGTAAATVTGRRPALTREQILTAAALTCSVSLVIDLLPKPNTLATS